jgi:hypothetical protein
MKNTSNNDIDRIKLKIQALINLGEDDGATEAEAENAMRFARRLMLQHNVSPEDMEEAKDAHESAADAEQVQYGQVGVEGQTSGLTAWEGSLAWAVSLLVGTVKWYKAGTVPRKRANGTIEFDSDTGMPKTRSVIKFYGPVDDCRDAQQLMAEWSLAVVALARLKFGGALRGDGRSYCEGFCDALYHKMNDIKREEQKLIDAQKAQQQLPQGATRSTALMVMNGNQLMLAKQERAKKWLEEEAGIKLSSGGSSRVGSHNSDAYGAGQADGRSANFSHNRTKRLK